MLKYQRVQEPAPSPYIISDDVPIMLPRTSPTPPTDGVYPTPAPYTHTPPLSLSSERYPKSVPAGYSMVSGSSSFEPASTMIDRQPYYPQQASP